MGEFADVTTWLGTNGLTTTQAFQAAVDYMYATYGGGFVFVPPGNFLIQNLIIKGGVILQGSGHGLGGTFLQSQNQDTGVIQFDLSCNGAGMRDVFACGYTNAAATNPAVFISENCPVFISNCQIWGGGSALFTKGVDGVVENSFISGWSFASLLSNGANWYKRCKFDTAGQHCSSGFYQGTPLPIGGMMENHFDQCDFSGDYAASINIVDGATESALSMFTGCVFSCPVSISGARHTSFVACEFGNSFSQTSGTCAIVGSWCGGSMSAPNAVKAANINIS
jgi:hypothetical protein